MKPFFDAHPYLVPLLVIFAVLFASGIALGLCAAAKRGDIKAFIACMRRDREWLWRSDCLRYWTEDGMMQKQPPNAREIPERRCVCCKETQVLERVS